MIISTAFLRINFISQFDANLFYLINHLPHNFFWDNFFGLFSFLGEYGAIWFFLAFLLFLKNQLRRGTPFKANLRIEAKRLAIIWVTGLVSLGLAFFLKEIFHRIRPEFVLQNVILPFGPDSSFSFPSGHALTSFVFATLLTKISRHPEFSSGSVLKRMLKQVQHDIFYILAVLISFSRLYLGYHYPLDVVAGAVVGIIVAKIALKIIYKLSSPTLDQVEGRL